MVLALIKLAHSTIFTAWCITCAASVHRENGNEELLRVTRMHNKWAYYGCLDVIYGVVTREMAPRAFCHIVRGASLRHVTSPVRVERQFISKKKKNKNLTWIYYILPFQISRKKKRFEILFWLSLIASSSQGSTSAAAESISIILLSWAYVIIHWTIRTDRERVGWWEVGVMIISGRVFFILCSFFFSSVSLRVMSHPPSYTKWPHVRRWIGRRNIGLIVNPLVSGCLTIEKKKGGA